MRTRLHLSITDRLLTELNLDDDNESKVDTKKALKKYFLNVTKAVFSRMEQPEQQC